MRVSGVAVQQRDGVRRRLDAARLAQILHRRLRVGPAVGLTVELGERDDGDVEILAHVLEALGEAVDVHAAVAGRLADLHDLEVVDDRQDGDALPLHGADRGPDLLEGEVGAVVDQVAVLAQVLRRHRHVRVVVTAQRVVQDAGSVHAADVGQEPLDDLGLRHLQREQDREHPPLHRVEHDAPGDRGLPDAGPCPDDGERLLPPPTDRRVELAPRCRRELLRPSQISDDLIEDVLLGGEVPDIEVDQLVDLGAGAGEQVADVTGSVDVGRGLLDADAGVVQLAHQPPLPHDLGVVGDVP